MPTLFLTPQEAEEAMRSCPGREPPDLMLRDSHEAVPLFHTDWTVVPGSHQDPVKWELELRLRDMRNMLLREFLEKGRCVFYTSSGNSMWPLVQSNDNVLVPPRTGCKSNFWGPLVPEG